MAEQKMSKPWKIRAYKLLAVLFVLFAFFQSLVFSNTPQIDMRAVVTVLGIDSVPGGRFKTSAHILVPVAAGETKSSQDLIESEGSSLAEAIDNLSVTNGTKVEISQCGMVIFGKTLSEKDVLEHVKMLMSDGRVSAGVVLISADKLEARDFLEKHSKMSDESSTNVNSFISFFENSLYMPTLTMIRFLANSTTESRSSFLPCIELKENMSEDTGSSGGSGGEGGGSSGGESAPVSKTKIESISTIVIFRDGKRVGILDNVETSGLSWTDKRSKRGFIQLDKFEEFGREYQNIAGKVSSKKASMKYLFKDGKPVLKVKVRAKIGLLDHQMFTYDLDKAKLSDIKVVNMLDRRMSDKIQSEIDAAINAVKRLDSDFMRLRYNFFRMKNKEMTKYESDPNNDFIRDLTVEYDIKCDVR